MAAKAVDLADVIGKDGTFALNASDQYPLSNLFNPDERLELRSDADEQLIINISFNETVHLSGIDISAKTGEGSEPAVVKLYVNRVSIGFEDVNDYPPNQELFMDSDNLQPGVIIPLKVVNFRSVSSLTIFVESNAGDEEVTALKSLKLYGTAVQGTKVEEIKKVGEE